MNSLSTERLVGALGEQLDRIKVGPAGSGVLVGVLGAEGDQLLVEFSWTGPLGEDFREVRRLQLSDVDAALRPPVQPAAVEATATEWAAVDFVPAEVKAPSTSRVPATVAWDLGIHDLGVPVETEWARYVVFDEPECHDAPPRPWVGNVELRSALNGDRFTGYMTARSWLTAPTEAGGDTQEVWRGYVKLLTRAVTARRLVEATSMGFIELTARSDGESNVKLKPAVLWAADDSDGHTVVSIAAEGCALPGVGNPDLRAD